MILIKGNNIKFELAGTQRANSAEGGQPVGNGPIITLPKSWGMIHDNEGQNLHYCDLYFGPYEIVNQPARMDKKARAYFGRNYAAKRAIVDVPKDGNWVEIGDVVQCWYTRTGSPHRDGGGGTKFYHVINKEFPIPGRVILYRCTDVDFYRMSTPSGCIIDHRGIVSP